MTTIETNTALTTDLEALRTAFEAQKEAAYKGLEDLTRLANSGMDGFQDMQRPELQNAFISIYDAALAVGATVQKIAETVGCEDYSTLEFKPTAGAEPLVQKLQNAINHVDINVKDAVGRIMGVSALAAIAVEAAGVSRTGSNLRGTFQALHDMSWDCVLTVESWDIEETEDAETVTA